MINYTEAKVTGRLVNVLCQVGFTTLSAQILILEIPIDRDVPIVVGRGFLDIIGGNIDILNRILTAFDGLTRQTFRVARSEKIRIAKSDSDDEKDYVIKMNDMGTPIHNSRPIGYQNNTSPAKNITLSTLESVINPFRKINVWKKVVSFLGSLPAKLRDVEWKPDYKLCYSNPELATGQWKTEIRLTDPYGNIYMQAFMTKPTKRKLSKYHKLSDIMTPNWAFNIREPIYPELCREFYATYEFDEVCADDELQSKKIISFRLGGRAHSLTLLEFARRLGLYHADKLEEEGFDTYFQGGLRSDENFNAREYWERISTDRDLHLSRSSITSVIFLILRVLHKMITNGLCQRTTGYEKIQRNDLWLLKKGDRSQKDSQNCCGQFDSKIARKSRVLTKEIVRTLSTPVYCRDLDRTTLRELINSEDRLIPDIPVDDVPRVAAQRAPRVQRASMHDLYERMGSIEIRQEAIERMEYRHAYHWDSNMDSSMGKMCLGKDVIEISSDRNKGSGDWDCCISKYNNRSGGKKRTLLGGSFDGEINLEKNDNLISNDYAVKLCLEYEVRKGNKLVKKELMVLLREEIYFVQFIINPEDNEFELGLIFGRSFLHSANAIVNFRECTITIQTNFDHFLLSSDEEGNLNLDNLETLLDFDFDEGSRNKKKIMENIMYFNGAGPSSSFGTPLTQEEAERRALAHSVSVVGRKSGPTNWIHHSVCQILDFGNTIDETLPIWVGRGFLDIIGGSIDIPNRILATFDGLTRQTFRAARSEKIRIAESDSDDKEDYVIKRNDMGTPIHNSRPIGYQNNTNPAENITLSTLELVINPFRKINVWKKALSFLGLLTAKLRDVEWKPDYKLCYSNPELATGQWKTDIRLTDPYGNIYMQAFMTKPTKRKLSKYHKLSDIMSPNCAGRIAAGRFVLGVGSQLLCGVGGCNAWGSVVLYWGRRLEGCLVAAQVERLGLYHADELEEEDRNLHLSRSSITSVRFLILRVLHKMINYGLCQRTTGYEKIQRNDFWLLTELTTWDGIDSLILQLMNVQDVAAQESSKRVYNVPLQGNYNLPGYTQPQYDQYYQQYYSQQPPQQQHDDEENE
ncbi:hypothetical protein Tco_0289448 [Tanacetum coccineum]